VSNLTTPAYSILSDYFSERIELGPGSWHNRAQITPNMVTGDHIQRFFRKRKCPNCKTYFNKRIDNPTKCPYCGHHSE